MEKTKWQDRVKQNESILLFWYRKITEAGHGSLSVVVNKDNGTVDVKPELSIRNIEEQAVFKGL